jgi:hypothetical protein
MAPRVPPEAVFRIQKGCALWVVLGENVGLRPARAKNRKTPHLYYSTYRGTFFTLVRRVSPILTPELAKGFNT